MTETGKKSGRKSKKTTSLKKIPKKSSKKTAQSAKTSGMPKAGKKSLPRRLAYWLSVTAVWLAISATLALIYLAHDLPDLDNLPKPGALERTVIVKSASGATLVRSGPIYGDWIGFNETPDALVQAFTAIEDRRFFDHMGIDISGLMRALFINIKAGGVRSGGSTITQQLAKNMFLSSARTLKRKAQELLLAFWLEQKFSKQQILTLYLNRVYFGGGAYGIDAASRKFFGHSARTLSVAESALIAGLVKAPSRLAPHINPKGAWARAKTVLSAMARDGALTTAAATKIQQQPPAVQTSTIGSHIRYFADWAQAQAKRLLPASKERSVILYATVDPAIQRAAFEALQRGLSGEGAKRRAGQGAIVAIDHDGAVRAMVGGHDYGHSQFNRAVSAKRQPGSAFKLFSYLAALEVGVKPSDRYIDQKTTVDGWSPKNYNGQFRGDMSVQEAFARSTNTVAVQIAEKAGRERVAAMAKRMGITTNVQPLASLPLGTEEVRLLDLASAYAAVANGGHAATPYGILEITSLKGQVLYRRTPPRAIPVLAYPAVKDITGMLETVVKTGSGKNARLDRPAAGKSGTSQDSRDAVFAGFTSDITAAVWVGNDDMTPMKGVTGGGLPARIWQDFMIDAHAGQPVRPLLADAGLFGSAVDDDPFRKNRDPVADPKKKKKKKKKSLLERIFGGGA